ncbi:PP2C family protein-serine/threonine phosphatase [Mycobacterium sp.]|uniref:PP2C family protein-serine/threonine phosphatase n=1 Tax=Mycobacterium sp. TaxID=1785 RepID=UPI003C735FD0
MYIIESAALSDIGCKRPTNQDRCYADSEHGLFVVADGVGSSSDGALAAQMVIELLPSYLDRHLTPDQRDDPGAHERLGQAVAELSDDLNTKGQTDDRIAGAATTVVAVAVVGTRALVAHLGDSRVYLWRERVLHQLTRDHTLVQALVDAREVQPEDAHSHPTRNVVTRFVAMRPPAIPDAVPVDLAVGDRMLLCSDGLHGVVDHQTLTEILGANPDPAGACAVLIEVARAAGGPDNITALVINVGQQA